VARSRAEAEATARAPAVRVIRWLVVLLALLLTREASAIGDAGVEAGPDARSAESPVLVDAGVPEAPPPVVDGGVPAIGASDAPDAGVGAVVAPPSEPPAAEPPAAAPIVIEWDVDGDGTLEPEEVALRRIAEEVFADVPADVQPEALAARPKREAMAVRSLTVERFRKMVALSRKKVLARLSARLAAHGEARMIIVSKVIAVAASAGVLLLLLPLFLARRYPNQQGVLWRYSALAAITFTVTVASFGAVSLVHRGAHVALAEYTSPQLALASGFFDTLDEDAPDLVVIGNEVFAPTLVQLQGNSDEQPAVLLIANGRKLVKDTEVFVDVARAFDQVTVVVGMIPSVVLVLSLVLFLVAIKPTLVAIVVLPARAASSTGASGGDVFRHSMRQVGEELVAMVASLAVLVVISLVASVALGRVLQPALATLISYFTIGVMYLRFVDDASSTMVLVMMASVVVFLVLNLAVIILSTTFFLAKTHWIFQQRCADKVPLGTHRRFWRWGTAALVWSLVFPWLYLLGARAGIEQINGNVMFGARDAAQVNWHVLMIAGPLLLVVGFIVALWASRAYAGLRFLMSYDVRGSAPHALLGVAEAAAAALGRH